MTGLQNRSRGALLLSILLVWPVGGAEAAAQAPTPAAAQATHVIEDGQAQVVEAFADSTLELGGAELELPVVGGDEALQAVLSARSQEGADGLVQVGELEGLGQEGHFLPVEGKRGEELWGVTRDEEGPESHDRLVQAPPKLVAQHVGKSNVDKGEAHLRTHAGGQVEGRAAVGSLDHPVSDPGQEPVDAGTGRLVILHQEDRHRIRSGG